MAQQNNQHAYVAAAHNPVVIVPARQTNGWGVFGLLVVLFGLFVPTGIVAALGLMICLIACGKSPRGCAVIGVLIGLLGTLAWLIIDVLAIVAITLAMATGGSIAFAMTQPELLEVTTDMTNVVIAAQEDTDDESFSIDGLNISPATHFDPWGVRYAAFETDSDLGFELVSAGPDMTFETDDDIIFSQLERHWEYAIENLGPAINQLGEKLHNIDQAYGNSCSSFSFDCTTKDGRPSVEIHVDRTDSGCNDQGTSDRGNTAEERPMTRGEQYEQEARKAAGQDDA